MIKLIKISTFSFITGETMKGYLNKKSILEAMGKNGKDVRYLERALSNGRVIMMWGRYYLQRDYIEWSMGREEEHKKEIKNLTDKIEQLEYQLDGVNRSMGENYNEIIHRIYVYLKEVLHINVRYDDLVDFIENYPSD